MFASILFICVSAVICCVLWRFILALFVKNRLRIMQYFFHCTIIFIYTIFAFHIISRSRNSLELSQDSICQVVCLLVCLVILHTLSVFDFCIQKVPNILLALLFICSNILYLLTHVLYNGYPFMILGIVYGIYFMLHLVGDRQYMGEGDVWIIACLSILLESFFTHEMFIFELLCCASVMGICYYYALLCGKRLGLIKDSNQILKSRQIPFIPFLSASFLCVSVWNAA